jgi:DNA-binding HxlR family transcriptional regulator
MIQADSAYPNARDRAGGAVLSLIASPLCVPIVRAHLDGPLRLPDLRERIGGAAQTTLRGQVGNLRAIGALERHVRSGMPYTVENEITEAGRSLLDVAGTVEAWLTRAPQGPIALGSEPAKGAIKALIGGWSSTMLRALAARPLSLTELDGVIPEVSYPSLERRLSAMRAARQIEGLPGEGGSRPYTVTEWTRQAVGPLAAAGRCECLYMSEAADPPTRLDIEAAFLLAVPLVSVTPEQDGRFLLAVDTGPGDQSTPSRRIAGVHVEVQAGEVASCVSRIDGNPGTWAIGTPDSWLDAIIDGRLDRLRLGGEDPDLAKTLLHRLHDSLATT